MTYPYIVERSFPKLWDEADMNQTTRFGRRLPLPSTAEIKHELRLMAAADELRRVVAAHPEDHGMADTLTAGLAGDLARTHGLSVARAQMLVDRFGLGQ